MARESCRRFGTMLQDNGELRFLHPPTILLAVSMMLKSFCFHKRGLLGKAVSLSHQFGFIGMTFTFVEFLGSVVVRPLRLTILCLGRMTGLSPSLATNHR